MNLVSNSVWNGLINWNYSFIVCRLPKPNHSKTHYWIAIYAIEKRINELSKDAQPWEVATNKIFHPFLFRNKGKYALLQFTANEVKEDYIEEPSIVLSNKKELFFESLDEMIVYLNKNEIELDGFMPPHTISFPLNHTTWGEYLEDN